MSTPFLMPSLSPTMTEGGIVQWHRREGDALRAGDVLLEIETDKAIAEVEAPFDGVLERILHPAGGSGVAVGTAIALVRASDAGPADTAPAAAIVLTASASSPAAAGPAVRAPTTAAAARKAVTPVARRLAREHGVEVAALAGSGPGGRVDKRDVLAAVGQPVPQPAASSALRLHQSPQAAAHFHLIVDCQVDGLVQWQQKLAAEGLNLSFDGLVLAACARALQRVPQVNATWSENGAVLHRDADIAVQVATQRGLLAPVLFKAQAKGLQQLSDELRALTDAARQGRLAPGQCQGGTFSVSNLGPWEIREFTGIVTPPQACVLALGAAQERPVVKNGAIVPAMVMTCTLSAEQRAVVIAAAAEFLNELRRSLEQPLRMVL